MHLISKFLIKSRYEDGSGGCDGCLNWEGVGYQSVRALANIRRKKPELYRAFPISRKTTNNKLQLAARSLELMFTVPNWPPGARSLTTSLKETGKSRFHELEFIFHILFPQKTYHSPCFKKSYPLESFL